MSNGTPKKGGGGRDMVMESRHLLGVFLGIVVLCGVFFTLGYVMGRTQYDASVRAALVNKDKQPAANAPAPAADGKAVPPVPGPSDWNFYKATQPKKAPEALKPAEQRPADPSAAKPAAVVASRSTVPATAKSAVKGSGSQALWKAPAIPRGAVVLQVAALTRESDALALAEVLQQKEYPAFVQSPGGDNLYRVQVGPYPNAKSAEQARRGLERDGFKTITRR